MSLRLVSPTKQSINLAILKRHKKIKLAAAKLYSRIRLLGSKFLKISDNIGSESDSRKPIVK